MSRPYHHGALRDALLAEAQVVLAEQGLEAISLRELARRLDVSHSAPERHFRSRQALLDALTIRGFGILTEAIRSAITLHADDLEGRVRAAARAYVDFAIENAALLELMFTSKDGGDAPAELFSLTAELVGEPSDDPSSTPLSPMRFVVVATLQGIATLVAAGRIRAEDVDGIIDQAAAVFIPAIAQVTIDR